MGEAIYSNLENNRPPQYLDGIQQMLSMRREFVQSALMLFTKSVGIMSWTGHPALGTGNVTASLGNVSQLWRNCPYGHPSFQGRIFFLLLLTAVSAMKSFCSREGHWWHSPCVILWFCLWDRG